MVILRLAFCQPPSSLVGWLDGGPSHYRHYAQNPSMSLIAWLPQELRFSVPDCSSKNCLIFENSGA